MSRDGLLKVPEFSGKLYDGAFNANVTLDARTDKRPLMADLRESGSLEQDADIVMFIYREDKDKEESLMKNVAEIIVSKHRNGPTGSAHLVFREHLAQFVDAATAHFDQTPQG